MADELFMLGGSTILLVCCFILFENRISRIRKLGNRLKTMKKEADPIDG